MVTDKHISVFAEWDPEAEVFSVTSEDVPGLVTEARNAEILVENLRIIIPELLELNGNQNHGEFCVEIFYTTVEKVTVYA